MRKIKICVRNSDSRVFYYGHDLVLTADQLFQGMSHDPSLNTSNATLYEVDSIPSDMIQKTHSYDELTGKFTVSDSGIRKIKKFNRDRDLNRAELAKRILDAEAGGLFKELISDLIAKSVVEIEDLSVNIQQWIVKYNSAETKIKNNK